MRRLRWGGSILSAALVPLSLMSFVFPRSSQPHLLTVLAAIADVEQTVLASGTIQPLKLVSIGAQASGRIVAMHVALGDHVTKGQLIAEIDPSTERSALENAQALLAQERAQRESRDAALKQTELAFRRAGVTFSQDASSRADYETAEAAYKGARADVVALDAQIRQAVAAVDLAKVTLGYTKVVSPMDGTVVAIVAPEGQTVNAVQAAPTIVKLADLDTMTVKVQISEADVTRVHPGQKVYFTILGAPDHRFYTTLRAVEPAPDSMASESPATGATANGNSSAAIYYNGLFDIENKTHELRPLMTAQVNIVLAEAKKALTIPSSAIGDARPDGRRLVRIADSKGVVQSRWVKTGVTDSSVVQVLDGLKPGDQVVLQDSSASQSPTGTS